MKKFIFSIMQLAVLNFSSAIAADLPVINSALMTAPTPIWTGFYAGLNSGYGFGVYNNAQNYGWANSAYFGDLATTMAFAVANSGPVDSLNQGGYIGGGQIGYNYQITSQAVVGLEVDMQGAGIGGTDSAIGMGAYGANAAYVNNNEIQAGIRWMGTARGRVGYLITPDILTYVTGGLAYGGSYLNTNPSSASVIPANGYFGSSHLSFTQNSKNSTLVGWTSGAGAEWMLSTNWSIKGEALYYNLGSQSVNNTQYYANNSTPAHSIVGGSTTRAYYQGIIARVGANYNFVLNKIISGEPVISKSVIRRSQNLTLNSPLWTTFYIGLNSGYGFGTSDNAQNYGWANPAHFFLNSAETAAYAISNSGLVDSLNQGGYIGGGQIGYNYQITSQAVVGLEVDMQGAGIGGTDSAIGMGAYGANAAYVNNNEIQAGIRWMGTARGRVGYLITPDILTYVTGGLAYGGSYLNTATTPGEIKNGFSGSSPFISTQNSHESLLTGWTSGVGSEWKFSSNWSIKGEALYYDLGSQKVSNMQYWLCIPNGISAGQNPVGGSDTRAYYQGIIARIGVNYHFNIISAPSVTKY